MREGKGTALEGGVRVPFVARWPGRIPAGTVADAAGDDDRPAADVAKLAGAPLPPSASSTAATSGRSLAGQRDAAEPHEAFYFYWGTELHAVRSGKWKLHLPHPYQSLKVAGNDGRPGEYERKTLELSLFDLEEDPGESTNVAGANPDVVKRLLDSRSGLALTWEIR